MSAKKRQGLHRFTKTHFVSEDSTEIVRGESSEPLPTAELIFTQGLSQRSQFCFRIGRRVTAGDKFLKCFATISDSGAKLAGGLLHICGVGAIDPVKPRLGLRR